MTISQKLFEIFIKIKQHIIPFFLAITVPNLNIFGATTVGPMISRFKKIYFPFPILVNSISFRFSAIFTDCRLQLVY